jgi:hypothetical protein
MQLWRGAPAQSPHGEICKSIDLVDLFKQLIQKFESTNTNRAKTHLQWNLLAAKNHALRLSAHPLMPPPPHGYQTQKLHHEWTISIKLLLSDIDHIASQIPVRIGNVPSRLHPTTAHWLAYLPIGYTYSTWSLIN